MGIEAQDSKLKKLLFLERGAIYWGGSHEILIQRNIFSTITKHTRDLLGRIF